jgi:hypothetical protein
MVRTPIRWPAIGVELCDQPHYGASRGIFIRVWLDCADNFLVVKTLAVKPGLRPAKLPDIRAFFASVSLHTSTLHPSLLGRLCGVEEYSGTEPKGRGGRNESRELLCGGNAPFRMLCPISPLLDSLRLADLFIVPAARCRCQLRRECVVIRKSEIGVRSTWT